MERAVAIPYAARPTPTSANTVHAGACKDVSHQPPRAITRRRAEPAMTGQKTLPAPCDAKKRHSPSP